MNTRTEDRDFRRFRKDGSPEALARVFDSIAPRLLLLAAHFSRDANEAEDLVQTTFLQAIRHAGSYDEARPVAAWLSGILRHRAIDLRRRRSPSEPVDEQLPSAGPLPDQRAAERELYEQARNAIEDLEDPYRSVLVLHLLHGLAPTAIAHAMGRPPGTVRMQLKRGLEKLRGSLPRVSAFAPLLERTGSERDLGAVREAVLAEAQIAWPTSPALSLGGALTMKMTLIALALVLVAVWAWLGRGGASSHGSALAVQPGEPAEQLATQTPDPALERAQARREVDATRAAATSSGVPDVPFEVRVSFASDGRPAAGIGVYVRAEPETFGRSQRTDERGFARFRGLERGRFGIHLDRYDAAEWVDTERTRSIEIRIPAGVLVHGTVVDLTGERVAGARVLRTNPHHHDRLQEVVETDANGEFTLSECAPGTEWLARAEGWQPSLPRTVRATDSGEAALELVLGARGHALRGRVVDADGAPAARAWIAIGIDEEAREEITGSTLAPGEGESVKPMDREAFFLRASSDGTFATDEVPAGHALVLARGAGSPDAIAWQTLWIDAAEREPILLQLEVGARIFGTVRDAAGQPIAETGPQGVSFFAPREGKSANDLFRRIPTARREDLQPGQRAVTVQLGSHELPTASLRGTWHGTDGAPIARGGLRLERSEWDTDQTRATDASGQFAFEDLSAGTYTLIAAHDDQPEGARLGTWELHPGESLDVGTIHLSGSTRVQIEVVARDGSHLEEVDALLVPTGLDDAPDSARFERAASGLWASKPVLPGDYLLRVQSPECAPQVRPVRAVEGAAPLRIVCERGEPLLLELDLQPSADLTRERGTLETRVWDDADRLVALERSTCSLTGSAEHGLRLAPGAYRIELRLRWSRDAYARGTANVRVPHDGPVRVELR